MAWKDILRKGVKRQTAKALCVSATTHPYVAFNSLKAQGPPLGTSCTTWMISQGNIEASDRRMTSPNGGGGGGEALATLAPNNDSRVDFRGIQETLVQIINKDVRCETGIFYGGGVTTLQEYRRYMSQVRDMPSQKQWTHDVVFKNSFSF